SSAKLNWVAGFYYLHEDLRQNQPIFLFLDFDKFGGFGVPPGPGAGDGIAFQAFDRSSQITNAYAGFGQADYAITDRLKITLGGRYTTEQRGFHYDGSVQFQSGGMDHFGPLQQLALTDERLSNSAFNYRAALDYKITADFLAYASIATGYKSGDFNGSFLSLNPVEIALQLQPVKPEHVTAYEAGFKSSWLDQRLIVDAAGFYNEYNDLQVFVLVPPIPGGTGLLVNVLDNAPKAHTDGIEAQIEARPTSDFTLSAQMGWLQTRLDQFITAQPIAQPSFTGKELPISPHFSLAALADYRLPIGAGALDLQFSVTYRSHQFFDISNDPYITQDGYWLENARVAYSWHDSKYEVAAYVRNLSDEKYYFDKFDLTSPFGYIQGIVGTPRSFGVEVNLKY
ncbi:MAG: TonB-dependent receptor, partial [Caulobacteraceae bacterium]